MKSAHFSNRRKTFLFYCILLSIELLPIFNNGAHSQTHLFAKKYTPFNDSYGVITNSFIKTMRNTYMLAGEQGLIYSLDQGGNILWSKRIGDGQVRYKKIIETLDSNYVLIGNSFDGSQSKDNIICINVNATGDTLWTKAFEFPFECYATSVESTDDKGFIINGYRYTPDGLAKILIIKLDSKGKLQWSKTLMNGNHANFAYAIKQTPDKGYVLISTVVDSAFLGTPRAALIKLDGNGNVVWANQYKDVNDAESIYGMNLVVTPKGIVSTIAITFERRLVVMKTDFSGKLIWSKVYGLTEPNASTITANKSIIQATADGGYITLGYDPQASISHQTALKLDSLGNIQWSGSFDMLPSDILQEHDSTFAILGTGSMGSMLPFQSGIVKTNVSGYSPNCITSSVVSLQNYSPSAISSTAKQQTEGKVIAWHPVISSYTMKSISGCIPLVSNVEEITPTAISAHPNPTVSSIVITGISKESFIEIYDVFGKRIFSTISSSPETMIDLSRQPKGLYFYRITGNGNNAAQGKIVLQ